MEHTQAQAPAYHEETDVDVDVQTPQSWQPFVGALVPAPRRGARSRMGCAEPAEQRPGRDDDGAPTQNRSNIMVYIFLMYVGALY